MFFFILSKKTKNGKKNTADTPCLELQQPVSIAPFCLMIDLLFLLALGELPFGKCLCGAVRAAR